MIPDHIEYRFPLDILAKPRHRWGWKWIWIWVVIVGVLGELFSDAGVWESTESIQVIDDCENNVLREAMAPRILAPRRSNHRIGFVQSEVKFSRDLDGKFPGTVVKIQSIPDFEAQSLTDDMVWLLKQAGWKPEEVDEKESHFTPTEMSEGVNIYAAMGRQNKRTEAKVLQKALDPMQKSECKDRQNLGCGIPVIRSQKRC